MIIMYLKSELIFNVYTFKCLLFIYFTKNKYLLKNLNVKTDDNVSVNDFKV